MLPSADAAVSLLLDEIRGVEGDRPLVGLATGGTFRTALAALGEKLCSGQWRGDLRFTHLDEYLGFGADRPGGMVHELLAVCPPLAGMLAGGTLWPVPHVVDAEVIAAHERRIGEAGGLALQLLGIGRNGHIGFNEPGVAFERRFHGTALAEATRNDARAGFAPDEPPRRAVTAGVASILAARRLVLCAFGARKAAAVRAMLHGEIGPACPASVVRRHDDALILLDRDAASGLDGRLVVDGG